MEKTDTQDTTPTLTILRSGDPQTSFGRSSPAEILRQYGPPKYLLSSSLKAEKCLSVAVLARVLYFTPGVFCPHATQGCLAACLGHSSGRMQMPTHAVARDRRTALYLEAPHLFLQMLTLELTLLEHEACRKKRAYESFFITRSDDQEYRRGPSAPCLDSSLPRFRKFLTVEKRGLHCGFR